LSRTDRRLRIAYLCDFDPRDLNLYSGGNARLFAALSRHAGDVHVLPSHWGPLEPLNRIIHKTPDRINIRLRWRVHLALGWMINRRITRELAKGQYDVLFCAYSFQSLHRVRVPGTMISAYTADATPMVYKNSVIGRSFGSYIAASRMIDPLIERAERSVFQQTDLLLWPSEWLRDRAQDRYALQPEQSVVVPWGANIDRPDGAPDAATLSVTRPLQILFVGRDWIAKGGPLVVQTLALLREEGIDARLTVVGCQPPEAALTLLGGTVTVYRSLDKANPKQLAQFQSLLRRSHFMMMASMESWGFAFCEASAYGLPSLCLRAGGVPVSDAINGHALPIGAEAAEFAAILRDYLGRPAAYQRLRQTSRQQYDSVLNWDVWGQRVGQLLQDGVRTRRGAGQ